MKYDEYFSDICGVKHAYLILAHCNFAQLRTLLGMLDDELNDIYVHVDANAADFDESEFEGVCRKSDLTFIKPRIKIAWGGYSIVRAEMALLCEAVRRPHLYYHLLSGMDLPIKSQEHIHRFFEENRGKEFLDLWQTKGHTLRRVRYFTVFPEGSGSFLQNLVNQVTKAALCLLGASRNDGVDFRQGSQWFSITHDFAGYIADNCEWVEKTFSRSTLCDELLIPTLLQRSPYRDNLYSAALSENHRIGLGNMRYIDWSRGGSIRHPWVFREEDFDTLMGVPHLWARKFDERVDSRIIDELAGAVGRRGNGI